MFSIKLINMPFASLNMPSIAISQLKAVAEKRFGDQVEIETIYLNHDFGTYFGTELFDFIASSGEAHTSGLGEWLFRQVAFPDLEDNAEAYRLRYQNHFGPEFMKQFDTTLSRKRHTLEAFLEQLIDEYELEDADLIGFTSMFFQTVPSAALARMLKERNPKQIIILGGANCEAPMGFELVKGLSFIDFIFSGNGLISFPLFLNAILEDNPRDCHNINGVFSRQNLARISKGGCGSVGQLRPMGDELDLNAEVLLLDYDAFLDSFEERFVYTSMKPVLLFETSRGCWWGQRAHCTFCGLNGGTMAYRSVKPENALTLIRDLIDRYGDRVNTLNSVDNIIPKDYLTDVFPKLDVPEHISFFYEVRADLTDNGMATLSKANVNEIQPGIESLATSTLKLMRKGTTAFNNINFLKLCAMHGIRPAWNLLIGFPGEGCDTYEKYLRDLSKLTHLPPPEGAYPVRFDRFSPYYNDAEKFGLDLTPLDYYRECYPFDEASLENLAYYFRDRNYQAQYLQILSKYVAPVQAEVAKWKGLWLAASKSGFFPELYFTEDTSVYDSRDGSPKHINISTAARHVLDVCDRNKTMTRIIRESPEYSETELRKAVEELQEFDLLFMEGIAYMTLVFERKSTASISKFFQNKARVSSLQRARLQTDPTPQE